MSQPYRWLTLFATISQIKNRTHTPCIYACIWYTCNRKYIRHFKLCNHHQINSILDWYETFAITLHSNCFFLLLFLKKIACGKNYVHVIWPRVFCAMMILAHEMRLFFIFFEWVGATKCAAENNKHVFAILKRRFFPCL